MRRWAAVLLLISCGDDGGVPAGPQAALIAYPSDTLLKDGHVALSGIPPRPNADATIVGRLVDAVNSDDGFGTTTGVFFGYTGDDIDPASLTDDTAFLIDLATGAKVPSERHARTDDHYIIVAPRPGEVLLEHAHYAAVLTTGVRDTKGRALRADAGLAALIASFPPLSGWLAQKNITNVAAATQFTTHSVTGTMASLRGQLQTMPAPRADVSTQFTYKTTAQLDDFFGTAIPHDQIGFVVQGTLHTPYWLSDSPMQLGIFNGQIRAMVDVPYSLALPRNGGITATFQAVRAIVFVHGLNGQRSSMFKIANDLCSRGYAVFAMDMPYHGARQIAAAGRDQVHNFTGAPGADGLAEEVAQASAIEFGDLLGDAALPKFEPRALRDAFRQGALEVMWAARLLQEGDLGAIRALDSQLTQLSFDNTRLLLVGISFGSFLGGPVLAIEPRFQAGLLSVPGGGIVFPALMYSLEYGSQFEPIAQGAYGIDDAHRDQVAHPPEFLFEYALYQQVVEPGDALALAPYVIRNPIGANVPKSVALLEAFADETVPNRATEPLAWALGLHLVTHSQSPVAGLRYVPPLPVDPTPAIANIPAGASTVTGGLMQFDPATHGMLTDPMGTRNVMPDWPPVVDLPSPVPVTNPTTQLQKLLRTYADSFYELPAPQLIDPFQ